MQVRSVGGGLWLQIWHGSAEKEALEQNCIFELHSHHYGCTNLQKYDFCSAEDMELSDMYYQQATGTGRYTEAIADMSLSYLIGRLVWLKSPNP